MKPIFTVVCCLSMLAVAMPLSAAKAYKWVDPDGKITYQDRPPPPGMGTVEEKEIATDEKKAAGGTPEAAAEKYPVVLYSAAGCEQCDLARNYLQQRRIPFAEKNVSNNVLLQKELIEKAGALAAPTITIGSRVMRGFSRSLLEGELTEVGYLEPVAATQVEPAKADATGAPPAENAPARGY